LRRWPSEIQKKKLERRGVKAKTYGKEKGPKSPREKVNCGSIMSKEKGTRKN